MDFTQLATSVTILVSTLLLTAPPTLAVQGTFKPLLEPNSGSFMCANDTPSAVLSLEDIPGFPSGVPEAIQCGFQCTGLGGCVGFNHHQSPTWITGGQCELFTFLPRSCTTTNTACRYYEMSGTTGSCNCKRFDAFDYVRAVNTYYKPIFSPVSWGEATKKCLELSPFAHLVILNSSTEYQEVKNYLQLYSGSSASMSDRCNFYSNPYETWYGYWTALRRQDVYTTDQTTCLHSPLVWVRDNTTSG